MQKTRERQTALGEREMEMAPTVERKYAKKGEIFVLFQRRYELGSPLVGPLRLHRGDPDAVQAATITGLIL